LHVLYNVFLPRGEEQGDKWKINAKNAKFGKIRSQNLQKIGFKAPIVK
jgi:hypothetical protein